MEKTPLLLIACFLAATSLAQQREADSLQRMLNAHPQEDTLRVRLMTELATTYKDINTATGLSLAANAVALAARLHHPYWQARSGVAKAVNLLRQSRNDEALQLLNGILYSYSSFLHEKDKAGVMGNIATVYFQKADYTHATQYDTRAKDIYERLKDSANLVSSLNNIGTDYLLVSDYVNTYRYLQEEQKIAEALHDTASLINMYANFVEVYNNMQDFEGSLENAKKSLALASRTGNHYIALAMKLSIGQIYSFMHDFAKAELYYNEVANDPELPDYEAVKAFAYTGLGDVNQVKGYFKASLQDYEVAKDIYEKSGDKMNLSLALNKIGNIYNSVSSANLEKQGINAANRLQTALTYQKQAVAYAEETGAILRSGQMYEDLSQIYKQLGRYEDAFIAFEKGARLKDSLLNDSTHKVLTGMEVRFRYSKREDSLKTSNRNEKAVADAKLAEQQTKNRAVLIVSGVLLMGGILGFVLYRRRKEITTKQHISELEMKALRAQINPHFIFNCLTSLYNHIGSNAEEARMFTLKFSKLMRSTLENSERRQVTLARELDTLDAYLTLESMRFTDTFRYNIRVDKDVDAEETLIPPLLLQPFLENSIKHGIERKDGKGFISLRISKDGDLLKCTVEDSGGETAPAAEAEPPVPVVEKKSMGIRITRARIELMNRRRGRDGNVQIESLPGGTRAIITLPFETTFSS